MARSFVSRRCSLLRLLRHSGEHVSGGLPRLDGGLNAPPQTRHCRMCVSFLLGVGVAICNTVRLSSGKRADFNLLILLYQVKAILSMGYYFRNPNLNSENSPSSSARSAVAGVPSAPTYFMAASKSPLVIWYSS